MTEFINTRVFSPKDIPALHRMMRDLAQFEGYLDDFAVGEEDILTRGPAGEKQFNALIAEQGVKHPVIIGMAVFYLVPYTYDLRPDLILKELFVSPAARGSGVGDALFDALRTEARTLGCGRIRWLVLSDNVAAKRFYRRHAGYHENKWEMWRADIDAS